MTANQILKTQFEIIGRLISQTLDELSQEILFRQLEGQANSIGFSIWHLLRTWDDYEALIHSRTPIYERDGWTGEFGFDVSGRGIEGSGMGTGFTPADVALVRPEASTLLDYHRALSEFTHDYLEGVSETDLAREVLVPWWNFKPTVARVYIHVIGHSFLHLGEAQFVRGQAELKNSSGE
jgi:hypothetical protein